MFITIDENDGMYYQVWRKKNRVRLFEVAQYLGVTLQYVSMFENNYVKWDQHLVGKYKQFIKEFESRKGVQG